MSAPQKYLLGKSALHEAAVRIIERNTDFIAPVRNELGEVAFERATSAGDLAFDYDNTLISPTSYLFPACDQMFAVRFDDDGRPEPTTETEHRHQVIFAIRPCDVAAISYLDQFFLQGDFADNLYAARRERTTLITIACEQPAHEHCFCSCCLSGPVAETGYDLQLSPLGDQFLVEVGTDAGAELLDAWQDLLTEATDDDVQRRDENAEILREELTERGNIPAAIRRITPNAVPDQVWSDIGQRCIGCGSCSLVCPMCTCFYVQDEQLDDGSVRRVRKWDSCRLEGYTLEASGFNPRQQRSQRANHYSYHKLSYRYIEENGVPGCVGCGRCAIVCMGGVDMPTVLEMVRREE